MGEMALRRKHDYVDNHKLFEAMCEHRKRVEEAKARGESPRVPVTPYVGQAIVLIAENFSHRPNFIGYSYRQEMVSDAIETCLSNAHHFNPNAVTRSGKPNPFSYFTKIIYHAFIHRITREKKEEYVRSKLTENMILSGTLTSGQELSNVESMVDLTTEHHNKLRDLFEKPKPEKKKIGLEVLVEEDEEIENVKEAS
ncbi:RNA polymerase sigma factor for late transcription [Caulobacter phage Cr30]|uniref:sigma factor for late transcription n=1 Tax=Caulobacter phage Cr30 TaxID=1357714 RepID=UPI0004A9B434|nr:sigma factor for late transcription [Caulobacter phage Cr30]AGS81036.1 RNA polymerase sigma factor for late transcription [Caulobacter phage Cr30]